MYALIQFSENDGGTVSVINKDWLTPRKCEVYWPPVKGSKEFEKCLQITSPDQHWKLYGVQRVFCETDNLDKAKQKLKLAEVTSDLQTEEESEKEKSRRKVKRTKRYISSSEDIEDQIDQNYCPPPLKKQYMNALDKNISSSTPKSGPSSREDQNNFSIDNISFSSRPLHSGASREDQNNFSFDNIGLSSRSLQGLTKTANKAHSIDLAQNLSFPSSLLQSVEQDLLNVPTENFKLTAYQDKVISMLSMIKTQNEQILSILNPKQGHVNLKPCFKFPLKTFEELEATETILASQENYDNLISYLMTIGGRVTSNKVSRVMKTLLDDCLSKDFNYYGKRSQKRPFCELKLRNCVIDAVKNTTNEKEHEIEQLIKNWLKHAPARIQKIEMKKKPN